MAGKLFSHILSLRDCLREAILLLLAAFTEVDEKTVTGAELREIHLDVFICLYRPPSSMNIFNRRPCKNTKNCPYFSNFVI